jgi:hypothetical protein
MPAAPALVAEFAHRYGNHNTRRQYVAEVADVRALVATGSTIR